MTVSNVISLSKRMNSSMIGCLLRGYLARPFTSRQLWACQFVGSFHQRLALPRLYHPREADLSTSAPHCRRTTWHVSISPFQPQFLRRSTEVAVLTPYGSSVKFTAQGTRDDLAAANARNRKSRSVRMASSRER